MKNPQGAVLAFCSSPQKGGRKKEEIFAVVRRGGVVASGDRIEVVAEG